MPIMHETERTRCVCTCSVSTVTLTFISSTDLTFATDLLVKHKAVLASLNKSACQNDKFIKLHLQDKLLNEKYTLYVDQETFNRAQKGKINYKFLFYIFFYTNTYIKLNYTYTKLNFSYVYMIIF